MITAEQLKTVNERIKKIEVKGKAYACVAARVQAFREMCPEGRISTEIISMADGIVVMKSTVTDETGRVLATGMAYEKEESSYINKTSYIENCETSAVGRALGMLGIGSDEQMASAEEVANAINSQQVMKARETETQQIGKVKALALIQRCEEASIDPKKVAELYKVGSLEALSERQHANIHANWDKVVETCRPQAS
jgi:hypothetical protein